MRNVGFPCKLTPRRSLNEAQALFQRADNRHPEGARRPLRDPERENARLRQRLAEGELDKAALKELVQGSW